jgi:hypothetical protein
MLAVDSYNVPDVVLKKIREFVWDKCIIGVGEDRKLDLQESFDDIGVSDREVMIHKKIIVKSLRIQ